MILTSLSQEDLRAIIFDVVNDVLAANLKKQQDSKLLTQKEAAKQLTVTCVTLRSYVDKGLLKEQRISQRKPMYRQSDIDNALKSIRKYCINN